MQSAATTVVTSDGYLCTSKQSPHGSPGLQQPQRCQQMVRDGPGQEAGHGVASSLWSVVNPQSHVFIWVWACAATFLRTQVLFIPMNMNTLGLITFFQVFLFNLQAIKSRISECKYRRTWHSCAAHIVYTCTHKKKSDNLTFNTSLIFLWELGLLMLDNTCKQKLQRGSWGN